MTYWANSGLSLKRTGILSHWALRGPELSRWRDHMEWYWEYMEERRGPACPAPHGASWWPKPQLSADIGDPKRDWLKNHPAELRQSLGHRRPSNCCLPLLQPWAVFCYGARDNPKRQCCPNNLKLNTQCHGTRLVYNSEKLKNNHERWQVSWRLGPCVLCFSKCPHFSAFRSWETEELIQLAGLSDFQFHMNLLGTHYVRCLLNPRRQGGKGSVSVVKDVIACYSDGGRSPWEETMTYSPSQLPGGTDFQSL